MSGVDEAIAVYGTAEPEIHDAIAEEFQALAPEIEQYAKLLAPVRTGAYRDSIYCWADDTTLELGTLSEYGHIIEGGSLPHVIEPVRAKALHFFTPEGKEVFARRVLHPGTLPYPVLHNTFMAKMFDIMLAVDRAIENVLDRYPSPYYEP
jgi:hypothetical protein